MNKFLRFSSAILVLTFVGTMLCSCNIDVTNSSEESSSAIINTDSQVAQLMAFDISKYEDIESKADLDSNKLITFDNSSVKCENNCAEINGNTATINSSGTYIISGTTSDGQIIVNLTTDENVYLVLKNANITCKSSSPINIQSAKNTYVIALSDTENSLTDGTSYSSLDESGEPDACLFSKDDLIVGGNGTLNITANYKDGIKSKDDLVISGGNITVSSADDGIVGKDSINLVKCNSLNITAKSDGMKTTNDTDTQKGNLAIYSGSINITSETDGIQAINNLYIENGDLTITSGGGSSGSTQKPDNWGMWGGMLTSSEESTSAKAIKATNTLNIYNGNINISSSDDAIHSNDRITLFGGTIKIASDDDGIHADTNLTLNDGNVTISNSFEGLESSTISIEGGDYNITASDDGLNAAGGDGSSLNQRPGANRFTNAEGEITINGGNFTINADGDGIDTNNTLVINGGNIVVNGPVNSGNSALDFDGKGEINGGSLIAVGMSGMAQQPTNSSQQNNVMINLSTIQSANTTVDISDSKGNSVMSYQSAKEFNSIIFSSENLKIGETYNISVNGTQTDSFTVNSVCSIVGQSDMNGGMGGMHGMDDGGMNRRQPPIPPMN